MRVKKSFILIVLQIYRIFCLIGNIFSIKQVVFNF